MHFQYGLNSEIYSTTLDQLTIKHLKLSFHKFIYIPQFQYSSKAGQFVFSERSTMKYFRAYHCRKISQIKFLNYYNIFLKITKCSDRHINLYFRLWLASEYLRYKYNRFRARQTLHVTPIHKQIQNMN